MLRTASCALALSLVAPPCGPAPFAQDGADAASVREALPSAEAIAQLPPDGGPEFNRLVFESSPYLRQHARNPVDWWPWGDAAFARAEELDRPVFLSIGYSTCHWCHVMEHESFEDEEVAALLNASFVCIKVDREERPDLDQIYMRVTQGLTRSAGGWPMTVVMTSERKPFFAGTYFPKKGRGGRPGLLELVPEIARSWSEERDASVDFAERMTEWLARSDAPPEPGTAVLGAAVLEQAFAAFSASWDRERGGFGPSPKFPVPTNLMFLLRYARRTGDEQAVEMVTSQLDAMRRGGIWDQVGHGIHRYSTDAEWLVPHFEKMLYDQALVALASTEAWQVTGDARWRAMAEELCDYVLRDLASPAGGFHSAEDADSEGEEGLFYLWRPEELVAALGEKDGRLALRLFGVEEGGNFREEATGEKTGESILHLEPSVADFARANGLEPTAFEARVEDLRRRLFAARAGRVRPFEDDKVLTDWNGLMIAALALCGRAFDEPAYTAAAVRAADFCLTALRREDGRLYKRWREGQAGVEGLLDDYAFLGQGLIELYQTTFDERWLAAALELTDLALARFWDAEHGGFFTAPDDATDLIVRAKEAYDGALPSGNSVLALNLLRLARLTGRTVYEERAAELFRAFAPEVRRHPSQYTQMLCALDFELGPTLEIVVAGPPGAEDTRAMLTGLARRFAPNKVVVFRPPGPDPAIAKLVPYTAEQDALEGRATAYVCENFTCRAPTTSLAEVLRALDPAPRTEPTDADGELPGSR